MSNRSNHGSPMASAHLQQLSSRQAKILDTRFSFPAFLPIYQCRFNPAIVEENQVFIWVINTGVEQSWVFVP
ncbi:hypothetical protein ACU4M6_005411 [Raoultella ornithinolytica]|uniref:hypothetical protein n=1 Tax=Raoultella ornithinolytica TaxID=54291 RepID=UPI00124A4DAF|nr:hypothetical protein [Raoultella ornithinolytica]EKQ8002368.1 hypothetical protein [Raoultella ornithinolytica]EKT9523922.1 hypothetical protein [Raoultella ornithinolytica]EKU0200632.1 hypothetical protein [Raoultella ornithinolytica]EKV4103737.1 hypothetical protein [Raoultella ornithinolytica]EKV8288691.1 hypothetical protein [Raoultella ornithinolytica]